MSDGRGVEGKREVFAISAKRGSVLDEAKLITTRRREEEGGG